MDIYLDESKVLQYFKNIKYNFAAPNAFAQILKAQYFTARVVKWLTS